MKDIAALVPMRHHSQRVPEKNYRIIGGKPLFHYILTTLLMVPEVDGIYVDTDSPKIVDGINKHFPTVNIINRPEDLCSDDVSMNRILAHDVSMVKAPIYLQTHSTNPLLKPETISNSINQYLENLPINDSLFSVTRLHTRLYDSDGHALNHDPDELIQTQDLPPLFEENSCIYIFTEDSLITNGHRIGSSPILFEINSDQAWDIDTPLDFEIVDYLLNKRGD